MRPSDPYSFTFKSVKCSFSNTVKMQNYQHSTYFKPMMSRDGKCDVVSEAATRNEATSSQRGLFYSLWGLSLSLSLSHTHTHSTYKTLIHHQALFLSLSFSHQDFFISSLRLSIKRTQNHSRKLLFRLLVSHSMQNTKTIVSCTQSHSNIV